MSRSPLNFSRRNVLAAMGLGAGAAGLAACGAPSAESADSAESNIREGFTQADHTIPSEYEGRTPIVFWAPFTGGNYEVLVQLFTEFNESQDEIVAISESVGSYADLNQKFTAALQAQNVPDIVCFPEMQWLQFHNSNALAPLDSYFDDEWNLDNYIQNYVHEGVAAGETFVVPFARSTPLFYYNKSRYKELGLPEEGPSTWEDLAEFAPELASVEVEGRPLSAFAFTAAAWHGQADIWGFGGANSNENFEITINDPAGVEWLEWQRKFMHDDGYGYLAKDASTDFQSGVAAGWRGSTASLTGQTKAAAEGGYELGTAFMLSKEGVQSQVPTGGSGLQMVRTESQERQDAVAALFRFLAGAEQSATWHLGTGYVPIVQAARDTESVKAVVAEDPNYEVALNQLENARTADYTNWDSGMVTEITAAMSRVYGDGEDPQSVLDTVAEELQGMLDDKREQYEAVDFQGWK